MTRNKDSLEAQISGCKALREIMSGNFINQDKAGGAGAIEAVLQALRSFQDAELQEQGFGVLGNLAAFHAKNKAKIGQAGGVETLVSGLDPAGGVGIQLEACQALCHVTSNSPDNQSKAGSCGAIQVTLALCSNGTYGKLREVGVEVLGNLARLPENQGKIAKQRGVPLILSAMLRGIGLGRLQEVGLGSGAFVLRQEAQPGVLKVEEVAGGSSAGGNLGGRTGEMYETSPRMLEVGCQALVNLASNNSEIRASIGPEGIIKVRRTDSTNLKTGTQNALSISGIQIVLWGLLECAEHAGVQEQGFWLLYDLANDEENRRRMTELGVPDFASRMSNKHNSSDARRLARLLSR